MYHMMIWLGNLENTQLLYSIFGFKVVTDLSEGPIYLLLQLAQIPHMISHECKVLC